LNKVLMALCALTTVSYLVYRGLYTLNLESWYAVTASWMLYITELWGGVSLLLFFLQIWEPTDPPEQQPLEDVTIDVFVPSYNEEIPILRGTLQACLAMDCLHRTYLLDDGNRPEIRQLCEELGVHYITRDNNLHAKAGNLNNALDQTDGEFVAILDADHIPEPNFLSRMVGYFRDEKLGFVQSPHAFSNFDTFQGRVNYEKGRFWDEGQLFYKVIQPARNATDSVIFAGSAALFRRAALKDVGYIATETITEDMHTGIRMSAKGWKTMYCNERLIAGQGATDVTTFHGQRLRWAEGNLSILAYDNPLTMKGLSLAQRLTYFASIIHWAGGLPRLLIYLTPILLLLTGVAPVQKFTWTLGLIFLAYIGTMLFTLRVVYRKYMNYPLTEYFNMANFWTQIRATTRALIYRKRSKFVVTNKSGGGQGAKWPHIVPQITLLALGIVALLYGWSRHVLFENSPDLLGMGIATGLVIHNSYFAILYLRVAMMATSKRSSYRHRLNLAVQYSFPNRAGEVVEGIGVTTDLNEFGLGFMSYDTLPTGKPGSLKVKVNGETLSSPGVLCYAGHRHGDGDDDLPLYRYGLEFTEMPAQAIDASSRIIQRYAVAPWYSVFDANGSGSPSRALISRRGIDRAPFKVPVCLETPKGEVYTCSRDISSEAMRCILAYPVDVNEEMRAKIFGPKGSFYATMRVITSREVTGPPHNVREYVMSFAAFEGQGRSLLQSLCELAGEPDARRDLMCGHDERHRPIFRPVAAASLMLMVLTPPTVSMFRHIHADDLTLVETSTGEQTIKIDQHFERILSESLLADKPDVRRLTLLKDALDREGRYDDLVRVCNVLVMIRPGDSDMGLALVGALTAAERYRDADITVGQWLKQLYAEGRTQEAAQFEILAARNLLRSGDAFGALEVFRRLFVANPDSQQLRTEYLGVLLDVGLADEALRQFSRLPQDVATMRDIVTIHTALQDFKAAELALMDLIRELPDDIALREELGNVLVWQGDFKNAVRVFRELHESHPEDAGLKMSLGEALSWSGQCREALDIFGGLIDRGDSSDRAVKGFLDAYIADEVPSANHAHRVQWMYKRHTHMAKLPWDVAGVLASALVRAGHESEGIDLLKEVLLENPENRDVRLRLADALVAAGRSNEAHPHFRALLSDAQNDSK
jgi:cellulose synthase/poly-beta-1,6-N-acetylglucosamine synthase-like glycosyltransferase/Flp pilus assembly protein TadD